MPPTTELLTVMDAAKVLGVSRWTVWRLIESGQLPAQKLGDSTFPWLIHRDDLAAYESRCSQPSPDESTDRVDGDAA